MPIFGVVGVLWRARTSCPVRQRRSRPISMGTHGVLTIRSGSLASPNRTQMDEPDPQPESTAPRRRTSGTAERFALWHWLGRGGWLVPCWLAVLAWSAVAGVVDAESVDAAATMSSETPATSTGSAPHALDRESEARARHGVDEERAGTEFEESEEDDPEGDGLRAHRLEGPRGQRESGCRRAPRDEAVRSLICAARAPPCSEPARG